MITFVIIIFVIGYTAIILGQQIKLDKAAAALLTGIFCWAIYIMQASDKTKVNNELLQHLIQISSILFFLLGTMTIVSIIEDHGGFIFIRDIIKTTSKLKLLWIIALITFFLSAILANLTTAIVMASLSSRLLTEKEDKLWFTGIVIIAANAGGAFSPLGDVTTTMLWIGGQITAVNIVRQLFFPSLAVFIIPLLIISPKFYNKSFEHNYETSGSTNKMDTKIILFSGLALLLLVPVFKLITGMPPFMCMLLSLGLLWIVVALLNFKRNSEDRLLFSVSHSLHKIDITGILFFLGILLAVAALESIGLLQYFAHFLENKLGNIYFIDAAMGAVSAIFNNISLVAASQAMYGLSKFPADSHFWELLALTTGTGGSILIIGSAAGVGAMGIVKISFMEYVKKISCLAIAGFVSGILFFILEVKIFNF